MHMYEKSIFKYLKRMRCEAVIFPLQDMFSEGIVFTFSKILHKYNFAFKHQKL